MIALAISATVVAVERFINRKRLKVYEIMRDIGWLTLIFAAIEFAYLFIVEAGTLNYHSAVSALWPTEWGVFKDLLLEAATAVFLILASVWLEQSNIADLQIRSPRIHIYLPAPKQKAAPPPAHDKCDVEW
jgi:hypothetical protein